MANHDLVMADCWWRCHTPPPEDCIFIFDEGHRLGETAVKHFGAQCRINTTVNWLERLPKQQDKHPYLKDKTITDMLQELKRVPMKLLSF